MQLHAPRALHSARFLRGVEGRVLPWLRLGRRDGRQIPRYAQLAPNWRRQKPRDGFEHEVWLIATKKPSRGRPASRGVGLAKRSNLAFPPPDARRRQAAVAKRHRSRPQAPPSASRRCYRRRSCALARHARRPRGSGRRHGRGRCRRGRPVLVGREARPGRHRGLALHGPRQARSPLLQPLRDDVGDDLRGDGQKDAEVPHLLGSEKAREGQEADAEGAPRCQGGGLRGKGPREELRGAGGRRRELLHLDGQGSRHLLRVRPPLVDKKRPLAVEALVPEVRRRQVIRRSPTYPRTSKEMSPCSSVSTLSTIRRSVSIFSDVEHPGLYQMPPPISKP